MERIHWTVSELTRYIRQMFDTDYRLQDVEVEGEVSDFRVPGSGHAYFTLKDASAELKCVMWRSEVQAQRVLPQRGDRVIARGNLSVFEQRGEYQLYCRSLRPAGAGDLHAQFEALKARLEAEGLFDAARKRPLPERPRTIGVVTSEATAALQDVLNVLRRRAPGVRVLLSPAAVQGEQAPPQIVRALAALNARDDVEVILLVRGGGSLEDLWCFNDERVARAVAGSRLPVLSGVGHEIDFTLADFAADLRAPTPSAAAELVTPYTVDDMQRAVDAARARLAAALQLRLAADHAALEGATARLDRLAPRRRIDNLRQAADLLLARAGRAAREHVRVQRADVGGLRRALDAVSPARTLARGYAVVRRADGRLLRDAADAAPGETLDIQLSRGRLAATVTGKDEGNG